MTNFRIDRCDACEKFEHNHDSPFVSGDCRGCRIRMFAEGHEFWLSRRAGKPTKEYRKAMEATFGEGWREAHNRVLAVADRIREYRAAKKENARLAVAERLAALREKLKEGA